MSNLIAFPKKNAREHQPTPEQVAEFLQNVEESNIRDNSAQFGGLLIDMIKESGYNLEEHDAKYICMIFESIYSLLLKLHSKEHPFQFMAEELFEQVEGDDGITGFSLKTPEELDNDDNGPE